MAEGQEPGSPTDFMYLYEDEVYKITNRGRCVFGRVVENFCKDSSSDGESEFNLPFEVKSTAVESEFGQSVESNSSDVESDSDTPVQRGEIRVLWHPSGSERVVAKETVGLSDRYIGRGQAVQRRAQAESAGEATQLGRRRDIVITASLRVVGTNHVLPCVLSDRLESLDGCGVGYVCIDGWVGIEYLAKYKLRLQSSDGSRLEYADSRVCPLVDYIGYCRGTSAFNRNSYYPGQVLCGELGSIDKANWIYITDEMKAKRKKKLHKHKFTVEALHVSKSVKWLYRVPCVSGTPEKPSSLLEGEELKGLKRLKIFEGNALVTGMRHFLSISENDVFVTKKQWQKVQNRKYRRLRKQSGLSKKESKENEEKYTVPSKPKKRACTSSDSSEPSRRAQKSPRTCELSAVDMEVDEGVREEAGPSISMDAGSAAGKSLGHMPADENNSEIIAVSCSSAAAASARSKRSQLRSTPSAPPPQPGSRVVVETLHTSSRAEVVWQDGTIETGIPSTHLYPFYDLDEQECFPGDFVVSGSAFSDDNNSQTPHGDYGVVQKVDHHGRTAIVKCYRTYTSTDEPVPQLMSESEVSLYDLKKHPDFQYAFRPLVIRVANFTGQDTGCTAGQVIEKCPSGHVKVMWAGGYTSMCWPQDLKFLSHIDDDYDDYELDLLDFLFPRAATENDQALSLESVALLASADSAKVDTSVGATSDTAEDLKGEGFSQTESAPTAHHYHPSQLEPSEPRSFYSAIKREIKMLKRDLPSGVWVRGFEDRIDLMALMIAGPKKTPYEDGLFLFDLQLGQNYPLKPPLCHYISYCSGMLNPNLYEDGTVCVSLLGTWLGRGVELWNKDSSLLQLIVSLQGLILNAEPYFNEPGYEKQKGSQTGKEKSLLYNEVVLLNLVQSMTKLLGNPPEIFRAEILRHFRAGAADTCRRLEAWVAMSHADSTTHQLTVASVPPPEFPLLPLSRGFCLTLRSSLQAFRSALLRHDIPVDPPAS